MSEGLNKVYLMGNLGADPELRATSSGQSVMNLRLACTESWWDKETSQRKERTEWASVVVWGKRAEGLAKILHKGSRILVEGGLRTSSYDDRDGNKRYKTEVVASNIILADSKSGGPSGGSEVSPPRSKTGASAPPDDFDLPSTPTDDIPF